MHINKKKGGKEENDKSANILMRVSEYFFFFFYNRHKVMVTHTHVHFRCAENKRNILQNQYFYCIFGASSAHKENSRRSEFTRNSKAITRPAQTMETRAIFFFPETLLLRLRG